MMRMPHPDDRDEAITAPEAITVTGSNLRALTHPLRVKLLARLRSGGRATASVLAREFDTTSGDVSYHLRQLARFGFISEDTEHGTRRERWWKATHQRTQFEELSLAPADREIGRWFSDEVTAMAIERLARASEGWRSWPTEWQTLFNVSDALLALTPREADELQARLLAVIDEFRTHRPDEAAPEGTRVVAVQFQTFLQDVEA